MSEGTAASRIEDRVAQGLGSRGDAARNLLRWTFWSSRLLATLFLSFTGCVIPLGPEFQNPPSAENFPPYVIASVPFRNVTTPAPAQFDVTIGDPNPRDTIYFRWVSDYPPYVPDSRLLHQGSLALGPASEVRIPFQTWERDAQGTLRPCSGFVPGEEHRLVLIVSDRPFRSADGLEDPFRFNAVENDATFPLMLGWNIFNCPP